VCLRRVSGDALTRIAQLLLRPHFSPRGFAPRVRNAGELCAVVHRGRRGPETGTHAPDPSHASRVPHRPCHRVSMPGSPRSVWP